MNKLILIFCLANYISFGQSFHPAAGVSGTSAIKKDSSCFVAWATGGSVKRGFLDISDTLITYNGSNKASFGNISLACGPATGSVTDILSLGDGGIAIMTFDFQITDGVGYDFAIFENGFTDNYMEFAFVEVSSDGEHFFRFPATTEVQVATQIGNASYSDCRMVNNLAGKYRLGYGTPFDLSDIPNDPLLDKQAIRFVKLIDVVGAISGNYASTDQNGTIINDPFPTPFESGGFDLEAIGVINGHLSIDENELSSIQLFPNPATNITTIEFLGEANITIYSSQGNKVKEFIHHNKSVVNLTDIAPGIYAIEVSNPSKIRRLQLIIL